MYDQKQTQKPTLSDIAVSGVIMFNNKKVVISWISNQNQKLKTLLKLPDTTSMVGKERTGTEDILPYKIDKVEKVKLKKEIKLQKQPDQKEHLTHSNQDIRGFFNSTSEVEVIC